MVRNKVTALLLAVVFACATFFTTTASAKEVNTSLSTILASLDNPHFVVALAEKCVK